jgi:hypothetical protein
MQRLRDKLVDDIMEIMSLYCGRGTKSTNKGYIL